MTDEFVPGYMISTCDDAFVIDNGLSCSLRDINTGEIRTALPIISPFSEGYAKARNEDGYWGCTNSQGGCNVFEIRLEDDVFVTDNTHVVDTKIHIAFHDHCFPCDTWTDFTFPILEEWKIHLVQAKDRCDTSFQLYFHDGPFMMKVHKDHAMMLTVDCIRDVNKIEFTFNCGYYDFLRALYHAMKHFAKILFANNMNVGAFSSVYRQTLLSIDELKKMMCDDRQTV